MKVFVLLILVLQNYSGVLTLSDSFVFYISSMTECDSMSNYPLNIYNVSVEIENSKLIVGGTLSTKINLTTGIKASVEIEKDEFGAWIKIPCVKKIGSCVYNDLCDFGISKNKSCPNNFLANNVPCRCPISEGTYTIKPGNIALCYVMHDLAIYTGKYWSRILLEHNMNRLACYEVYFQVKDKQELLIEPFVELI